VSVRLPDARLAASIVDSAINGPKAVTTTIANSAFEESVVMVWRTRPLSILHTERQCDART